MLSKFYPRKIRGTFNFNYQCDFIIGLPMGKIQYVILKRGVGGGEVMIVKSQKFRN